eukprot:1908269-Rhodomonas_salina.3
MTESVNQAGRTPLPRQYRISIGYTATSMMCGVPYKADGTDIAYAATRCAAMVPPGRRYRGVQPPAVRCHVMGRISGMCLRACYAMSGRQLTYYAIYHSKQRTYCCAFRTRAKFSPHSPAGIACDLAPSTC